MTRLWTSLSLIVLLGIALLGTLADARATTVSNIAELRYSVAGQPRTLNSNPVSFDVGVVRTASTVAFLRAMPGSGGTQLPQQSGQCKRPDGAFDPISVPQQAQTLTALTLQPAVSFTSGETIYLSLADGDQNLDGVVIETIEITISSSSADSETLRLFETGPDTGVFVGALPTHGMPPAVNNDCRLLIASGGTVDVRYVDAMSPSDTAASRILVDPYGVVFDSLTGAPVDGARVTLVDELTGQPAQAFGEDGVSAYPSSMLTGETVTDGAGISYPSVPGAFRFPFVAPGRYRLVVEPPTDYRAPSVAPRASLALLVGPNGAPFVIDDGSFGLPFTLAGPQPVRIDIPIDRATQILSLEKFASTSIAEAGDFVHYRLRVTNRGVIAAGSFSIVDHLPQGFRYKAGSLRGGDAAAATTGNTLTISVPALAANATVEIGYTLVVGPEAPVGNAINRAGAVSGPLALSNEAVAAVRVRPPFLTDAATIIGRISEGQCGVDDGQRSGVEGVRLLMEDGSYVVSDRDGRYHFEGVAPGLHVVQVDLASLPPGYELADCIRNTQRGGRAFSTFVELSGGSLWRADFVLRRTGDVVAAPIARPAAVDDATAAGANTDWLAGQSPGTAILFPDVGHNPRAPSQRFVVKHPVGSKVVASVNGVKASPLSFDGVLGGAKHGLSVSRWRALPLAEGRNLLKAEIIDASGATVETLTREVWFTNAAARAAVVVDRSVLIADGRTRPVIAVRFTDAAGRPVRGGSSGSFSVGDPYLAAAEVDTQQQRQLAGLDRRPTEWRVEGDDGIAYIALAPTTQTGTVRLGFEFQADRTRYRQDVETWLSPGDSDWVMVGYVAGTTGFNTLRDKAKLLDHGRDEAFTDGEASFYAKGKVLGKWLLTMAFDDDRKRRRPGEPRQLLRTIDPDRYYTVYGDGSEQRYDAPTSDRLYLRLERRQFYALYGDFETGLTRTELTRYSRTLTGVKTEYRSDRLAVNAFAADTGLGFQRDEIQGNGLSGPYRLSRRDIVLNSEKVIIEVRDRFRSNIILSSTPQTRNVDYDFDALTGSIRFRQPVASRDADLNPQFIVIDYETETAARTRLNAGGRAAVMLADGKVEVGTSYLRDADNSGRTEVGGIDVRLKPRDDTEIRLEAAVSDRSAAPAGEAVLAEVEHHGERVDVLGYFRQQDATFGVGQQNASQGGTRKYGVDASARVGDNLRVSATGYREEYLIGPASRTAFDLRGDYRVGPLGLRGGFRYVDDNNQTGDTRRSTLATTGISYELFNRRLVLDADAEIALGGDNDSADFPSRYRLGARYAITDDVRLVLAHEIADGESYDAQTTEVGLDIVPWTGGRLATTLNQRAIAEAGPRTFAALGLTQSLLLGEKWGFDVSFDSQSTLKGDVVPADVLDRAGRAELTEDFWALSLGATYRGTTLSWNGRAEYRNGDAGDRYGVTTAVLRQTTGGIALAASAELFRVKTVDTTTGATSSGTSALLRLSGAYRPEYSRWSLLDRLDFSLEDLAGAALPGPFGFTPGAGGKSRRIVNNLALNRVSRNWIGDGEAYEQRAQMSLYWGAKYVFDRYDGEDFGGFAQVIGLDVRRNLGETIDIGFSGSVHHVATGGRLSYSLGPNVGVSPFANAWVSVGYNVAGYHDRDFSDERYTREGPYVTFRLKLDQMTPEAIFGARSRR
jgi:uncharacterized repeat protein (TIGR01451 family)